ncbi:hypothetical protein AX16_004709 [Volvariella volvacea WC 439]|nr:hypothetical protein AX16_004709 [Volvariella volvacea WC 439]
MHTTPSLPHELYRTIFEGLRYHTRTLLALALTCHSFYDDAVRLLYYEVVPNSGEIQLKFLRTIVDSQALASLVRAWAFDRRQFAYDETNIGSFALGACALNNLDRLCVSGSLDKQLMNILESAPFQLKGLHWGCAMKAEKQFLCSWIKSQPSLIELQFDFGWLAEIDYDFEGLASDKLSITPTATLPPLVRVCGSYSTLASLLPFCPTITEVIWTSDSGDTDTPQVDKRFLLALSRLRKLAFDWHTYQREFRGKGIAACLSNLEVLEISNYIERSFEKEHHLDEIVNQMPNIQWIVVSYWNREFYTRSSAELAQALFRTSRSLQYASVSIINSRTMGNKCKYHHFKQDMTSSCVSFTAPVTTFKWVWGFSDTGYLRPGWDGQWN